MNLMERLVFDVVLSVIGDEAERLSLDSDFDVLDVDQLTMTHIVLALESRLAVELPTNLEEAKTVAELVAGAQKAFREIVVTVSQRDERRLPSYSMAGPASHGHSSRRNAQPSHRRLRRHTIASRAMRL